MARREKEEKTEEITYEEIYNHIKREAVPILTLDKNWHDLFAEGKPKEIERLEKEVNGALKSQGRVNSERQELNQLKQTLLKKIVDNMDAGENSREAKKIDKSRELIEEINDKLILIEDKELSLPSELDEANASLLMESMRELCERSMKNKKDIEELETLIEEARLELKKKILLRQQKAEENEKISKFFNHTVGRKLVRKYESFLTKSDE